MAKGIICIIAASIFYGTIPTLSKILILNGMTESGVTFYYSLASVILYSGISINNRDSFAVGLRRATKYLVVGAAGLGLTGYLLALSYSRLSVGIAEVLYYIYPTLILIAELIIKKKKVFRSQILTVVLVTIGLILFSGEKDLFDPFGALLAILAALSYAVYFIINEYDTAICSNSVKMFFLTLGTLITFGIYSLGNGRLALPTSASVWAVFGIAIVLACVSPYLMLHGIARIGAEKAAFLNILEPIIAFIISAVVFHDKFSAVTIIGASLLISGAILDNTSPADK